MKPAQWLAVPDEKAQARLRGMRGMLAELTGPAGKTARWILEDESRWGRLCWIAQRYAETEPLTGGWKGAQEQWQDVLESARMLNDSLARLGESALTVRQWEKVRAIGQWETVAPWLHPVPGEAFAPPVHDLEWFAKVAVEECERMKVECNGARARDQNIGQAFMFAQLFDLLEIPAKRPHAHAQRFGAVIHAWTFLEKARMSEEKKGENRLKAMKKEVEKALKDGEWKKRFGEAALKEVIATRKGTGTPA